MRRYLAVCCTVLLMGTGCGQKETSLLLIDDLPKVASIAIEGNHRFSDGTLKDLMTVSEEKWWSFGDHKFRKAQLESDLKAILTYYLRHGYLRAEIIDHQVRHTESRDRVHITIRIREGDPVSTREVVIQGASALNPNLLRENLAVKAGKAFDPFALQDDERLILRSLGDIGFWNAKAKANVQFFGDEALVFYQLDEGIPFTLREVSVLGNREVETRQVLKNISVKEGELLRYEDLVKSQTRLFQSGYFSDARWDTTRLDTLAGEVDVDFLVRERKLNWFEAGIGFSSQEQFRFIGEWGDRNFFGTGMRFAVNSRTDLGLAKDVKTLVKYHQTDLILNRSNILNTLWEAQLVPSYFYIREATQEGFEYKQDILRAALTFRKRFGDLRNQFVFGLENRWVWNDADARIEDPQLSRDAYQTRLISGYVERDTRNDFFSPTHGSYERALVEWAGGALGGNNGFIKMSATSSGFRRVPIDKWSLSTRFQFGYTIPTIADPADSQIAVELIPTEDRFFLGGANTVRGYAQNGIDGKLRFEENLPEGGLAEVLFNIEFRVPLVWKLGTVAFLDAGTVWQDNRLISFDRFVPHSDPNKVSNQDVRYTYGLGLRLATPIGPIRLDYARKWNQPVDSTDDRSRWHFALGQAF